MHARAQKRLVSLAKLRQHHTVTPNRLVEKEGPWSFTRENLEFPAVLLLNFRTCVHDGLSILRRLKPRMALGISFQQIHIHNFWDGGQRVLPHSRDGIWIKGLTPRLTCSHGYVRMCYAIWSLNENYPTLNISSEIYTNALKNLRTPQHRL